MTLNLGAAIAAISSIRTEVAQATGCPEWDNGGIRAALIGTDGAAWDVLAAACLAAADSSLQYPSPNALVTHWPKNATAAPRRSMNVPCPDHDGAHDMPCPVPADPVDPSVVAALVAEARAANAAGLHRFHSRPLPGRVPPPGVTPKERHHA